MEEKELVIGYARISTDKQSLERQKEKLFESGCNYVRQETMSGFKNKRPVLEDLLKNLKPNQTIMVTELDRLGRSLSDLLQILERIKKAQGHFVCLAVDIDTRSPSGKLIFSILGAVAEFERNLIVTRIKSGLTNARKQGKIFGRRQVVNETKLKSAISLFNDGFSVKQICKTLEISKSTYYLRIYPIIKKQNHKINER